MYQLVVRSPPL